METKIFIKNHEANENKFYKIAFIKFLEYNKINIKYTFLLKY